MVLECRPCHPASHYSPSAPVLSTRVRPGPLSPQSLSRTSTRGKDSSGSLLPATSSPGAHFPPLRLVGTLVLPPSVETYHPSTVTSPVPLPVPTPVSVTPELEGCLSGPETRFPSPSGSVLAINDHLRRGHLPPPLVAPTTTPFSHRSSCDSSCGPPGLVPLVRGLPDTPIPPLAHRGPPCPTHNPLTPLRGRPRPGASSRPDAPPKPL